ncbi:MAG: hypothetical protein JRF33_06180 [Deltaproteobacteria bacterium]|nr:hypothetical protein [Deltaproteobacteria bacterium]
MKHICLPQFGILFCSLFVLVWVAAGCGEDGQPFGTDAGTDAEIDAGLDAGGDPGGDSETDAGLDANGDLEIDAGQDANGDQGIDAGQDAGYPNEGESLLVFSPGEEGAWDHRLTGAFSPSCMVKFNGTYFLYYIGASGDRDNSDLNSSGDLNNPDDGPAYRSLGVATSSDGVHFSKYAGNPLIEYVAPRDNEEGVFSCAAVVVDNEIQLYYSDIVHIVGSSGGVNANARMRKSSDGFTFTDDTLFMSFSDSTIWGYGDELFPIGVTTDSTGAIQLYYVAKGHAITWGLGLSANGSYEGLINSDTIGGGSVVKVNGKKKLFTIRGSNTVDGWYSVYNKESREILPSGQLGPVTAHTPSATSLFTDDVGPYVVFYDEGLDRWFLYYRSLSDPDSGFYMRTATGPDGDGAGEPTQKRSNIVFVERPW